MVTPTLLAKAILSAEADFNAGRAAYVIDDMPDVSPAEWTPEQVVLARSLMCRTSEFTERIAAHWRDNGFDDGPAVEEARSSSSGGEDDDEYARYSAWMRPLPEIPEKVRADLEPPDTLFHLQTRIAHSPGLSWSTEYEAVALTRRIAVLWNDSDDLGEDQWFPRPVALIDRSVLDHGIGEALRETSGLWFESEPDVIESSHSATDLFRILAYASEAVGDEVWEMLIEDLAEVELPDSDWGYVDLVEWL